MCNVIPGSVYIVYCNVYLLQAECPHLLVPLYYLYAVLTASLIVFLLTALVLLCR